jgi:hypothetical protein
MCVTVDTDTLWQWKNGVWVAQNTWVTMTQAAYDALTPKDPNVLYIIVG